MLRREYERFMRVLDIETCPTPRDRLHDASLRKWTLPVAGIASYSTARL